MDSNATHSRLAFLNRVPRPSLIGMIHVGALPGTPRSSRSIADLARQAADEAALLASCGVDAIMLENMHDLPYLNRRVGPEIVAGMTAICAAARASVTIPLGVQVLAGANRAALAVAQAAAFQFVRCEGFVFSHVADEGLMPQADAGPLLRFRRRIGADPIGILADLKKKHAAHAITSDVDLVETARAAAWCGADAVVVTGVATGRATDPREVAAVKAAVDAPVLVGSGVSPDDVSELACADGLIVGSYLKRDGHWANPPEEARVRAMVQAVRSLQRPARPTS